MTPSLPHIAIPEPTSTDLAYNQRCMPQYVRAVEAAGGVAVKIPLHASRAVQADLLASCSAVLLPGSPADIDPRRYGQQAVKETAAKDELREATDNLLLQDASEAGKPVLGICYGLQSLNVWRRGTLIQDLPTASAGIMANRSSNTADVNHAPGRPDAHPVLIAAGSRLAEVVEKHGDFYPEAPTLIVNSSHHQAIAQPGEDLGVVATSPLDGVIEALEGQTADRFVVAVQWHPERTYDSSAVSRGIFDAFLQAAANWASAPDLAKS